MTEGSDRRVTVIVLAYGPEPGLSACVDSILSTTAEDVEVLLIDNGATAAARALARHPRLRIEKMPANLGFAGGCNEGARLAEGSVLVFVNSDVVVTPGAIESLVRGLGDASVALVSGRVVHAASPERVNSVGNPVHFLGFSWAGGNNEPAGQHAVDTDITSISGAFFAVTREVWNALEGFNDLYFAYHEDADLSLRAWAQGWRVRYIASAVAAHDYEFSRNPQKMYLLERNRLMTVLTVYPRSLLILLAPALVAADILIAGLALRQGWFTQKRDSWSWLWRHRSEIREVRRRIRGRCVLPDGEFAHLLTGRLPRSTPATNTPLLLAEFASRSYWAPCRRLCGLSKVGSP